MAKKTVIPADPQLQQAFDKATTELARDRPDLALQFARQAWSLAPNNSDICNLIGVCAMALGDSGAAEQCWRQAAALRPDGAEAHYNLAMHCADSGRIDEAECCLRRTLAIAPDHAQACARLGALLAADGREAEAQQCYRRSLDLDPRDAATCANLGVLLAGQKRDAEAEQAYLRALALAPADAKTLSNFGILLARNKRSDAAEQAYRQAIALDPASAEAYTNLGLLLETRKRMEQAERCQMRAACLHPDSAEIQSNLANLLTKLERFAEAEAAYRRAIGLNPGSAAAHSNFGVLLAHSRRDAEAEQHFRVALSLNPSYQMARLNLAILLLAQGRFSEGWAYHEARYHPDLPDPDAPMPILPFAQWRGEPLAGKSLLIWPEQGFGDMIQFCRYVPLLKEFGARSVALACRPALLSLMRTVPGADAVFAVDAAAAVGAEYDYWTLPMSLPLHFHTELSSIPAQIPYLHAPLERQAAWSQCLPPAIAPFRVGLVWRGNPMHANDARRSLPGLSVLAPLWSVEGVQFVSLQHGPAAEETRCLAAAQGLIELGSRISDFADTAAILEQLDLLISVDTAVAHLAGALGKRCWVLLPNYRTDWRWMHERDDSPWYPENMRLFRQAANQEWNAVIENVVLALREHLAAL